MKSGSSTAKQTRYLLQLEERDGMSANKLKRTRLIVNEVQHPFVLDTEDSSLELISERPNGR
jgi:hypothetical protein